MKFPGKRTNQISKNGEKPNVGADFGRFGANLAFPIFLWILPLLVARHFSKLSLYAI